MFRDEMIDLTLFIMVLGIVVSVGLGLAVRTEAKARRDGQILAEDKNTRELRGYGIDEYGDFDGSLTRAEAVLMIQVQDYYMPEPKKVTVVDVNDLSTPISIVSTYKDNLATYGANVFNCLKGYEPDVKYELRYDKGLLANDDSDDTYLLSKKTN